MKLSNYNYIFLIKRKNSHTAYAYQQSIRELIRALQLRMKTLENTSIIFGFIFLFGNGNGRARSGKQNQLHGNSNSKQFDRKRVDNGWEIVLKSGSINICNHFKRSTQRNKFNHTYKIHSQIKL